MKIISLSDYGKLRLGKKSDLLEILLNDVFNEPSSFIDAKLLDGAAVVHLLPTTNVVTFNEYADQVFLPYISKQLESCTRVDVVWDRYLPNSIKESTREKRGKGIRRKVSGNTKLPRKWAEFYVIPQINKSCLNFSPPKLQAGVVLLTDMLSLRLDQMLS